MREDTMHKLISIALQRFDAVGINVTTGMEDKIFFSILGVLTWQGFEAALNYVNTAQLNMMI